MSLQRKNFRPRHAAKGVSLIEVLISVLVMGIGMLGIAAMQATALRNNQSALERSQAVVQSYAILDAMRANAVAARAGEYNMAMTGTAPTGATLADTDRADWINALQGMGGIGGVPAGISRGQNFGRAHGCILPCLRLLCQAPPCPSAIAPAAHAACAQAAQ